MKTKYIKKIQFLSPFQLEQKRRLKNALKPLHQALGIHTKPPYK